MSDENMESEIPETRLEFSESLMDNDEQDETFESSEANGQQIENEDKTEDTSIVSFEKERLIHLPLARIKHIMKMDPDLQLASQEAVFLVTKATELFIESLTREAYSNTLKSKKKIMQRRDLDSVIAEDDSLCFLEGILD